MREILIAGTGATLAWVVSWSVTAWRKRQAASRIIAAFAGIKRDNAKAYRIRNLRYMSPELIRAEVGDYKRDTLRSIERPARGPFHCEADGGGENEL